MPPREGSEVGCNKIPVARGNDIGFFDRTAKGCEEFRGYSP
jgi:hypothetical protein